MYGASTATDSKIKNDVGMAPLPCDQTCAISLGGWTLSAFKATKQPDNAWKFIQFMTDKQRQVKMAVEGGNTPTRVSAEQDPQVSGIPLYPIMFDALKTAVSRSKYKNYPAIQSALSTAISAAVSGSQSASSALQQAAAQIKTASAD
jgi:ABC-type glycerol-3-phosphate transport system substrate-binding protein